MTEPDLFSQPTRSSDPESGDDAAYSFDGKRDQYGRYRLPDPDTGKPGGYTRATTFAKSISDTFILSQWGQRMVGKGVSMRPDLIAAFASTPFGERKKLNDLAEQAKTTAGAKEGANLGSALHTFTEQHDRGERPDVPAPWDRDVKAYAALLDQEGLEVVPELIERIVLWRRFGIAGTFDRIVRVTREIVLRVPDGSKDGYRLVTLNEGDLVVLDLKTGRALEYGWLEIAVQLTCYARADLQFDKVAKQWLDGPDLLGVRKDVALVVHLPTGKGVAELHAVDLDAGHELAELCARVRNARKVKGLAQMIAVVEIGDAATGPNGAPRDDVVAIARAATFEERIGNARTVGDLALIRRDALVVKAWTPSVELKALARRDAILADSAATISTAGA